MFSQHLSDFDELVVLRDRVSSVLAKLPAEVRQDLLGDPRFHIAVDNFQPGKGSTVWMAVPSSDDCSRSVVLRPKLADCSEEFAFYVIAHEFAHAYLRNGGWGEIVRSRRGRGRLGGSLGTPTSRRPISLVVTRLQASFR